MNELMNNLYMQAIENSNMFGGYASIETDKGIVTCVVAPRRSRLKPGSKWSYSKNWRLDEKTISAANLKKTLDS